MSAYEELVERCAIASVNAVASAPEAKDADVIVLGAVAVLREVLRTLEMATPEMLAAAGHPWGDGTWLAMLHASPLAPP